MSQNIFEDQALVLSNLRKRKRTGKIWSAIFLGSTLIAILALLVLLLSILNQTAGLVAVVNKVNPTSLSAAPLETLSKDELAAILQDNLSRLRFRSIEREKALADRSREEVYQLVLDQVVQPKVVASYNLDETLLRRKAIEAEIRVKYPDARLEIKFWLTPEFLTRTMSSVPEQAGVRTALLGSLSMIAITILFAFPVGVGAAIFLEEYADRRSRINRIIQTNIDNLAGVPSIVYGILGLAIFVRVLGRITGGAAFGMGEDQHGRTILSAALTLSLLILPILIINAQEAIRAVPNSLRQAAYGLGATRWQTIWYHVLPYALPGILTGTILAVSRAVGETAPLIIVGASTFITQDPNSPFSRFTALPIQIYNWTTRPQDQFRNIAAAAIIVLLGALLTLNATAILLRNRFSRQHK